MKHATALQSLVGVVGFAVVSVIVALPAGAREAGSTRTRVGDCSSSSDSAKSSFSGLAWMSSGSIESALTLGAKATSLWRKVE